MSGSDGLQRTPNGTRGSRTPPRRVQRRVMPLMTRIHRRTGNRFGGMDLLYLTTLGAKSGQERSTTIARFDDQLGGWIVVASASGAATHPAWYFNITAHPDHVYAEVAGIRRKVLVEQLSGAQRDAAWHQVVASAPRFAGYRAKTDRTLPLLRLTPDTD